MCAANTVIMVKPTHFSFNAQTAASNSFQTNLALNDADIKTKALAEFNKVVATLQTHGITVVCLDSPAAYTPDAIFPNNWLSTHVIEGKNFLFIYPMLCQNRREEVQVDVLLACLHKALPGTTYEVIDWRGDFSAVLEGTGAFIFDHKHKVAFVSLSVRAELTLAKKIADKLQYELVYFSSVDKQAQPIYHTNVMLSVGEDLAFVCLEAIPSKSERDNLKAKLLAMGKLIIELTLAQVYGMAGNVLELQNQAEQKFLLLSTTADAALTNKQKYLIDEYCTRLPCDIHSIETISGGSVRCMLAELFYYY